MNALILAFNHEQVPCLVQEWHFNWMKCLNSPTLGHFAVDFHSALQGCKLPAINQQVLTQPDKVVDAGKCAGADQIKLRWRLVRLDPTMHSLSILQTQAGNGLS